MIDVKEIRKDFSMITNNPNLIYFDNGATTYKPKQVIEAVRGFYENYTSNIERGDYKTAIMADNAYHNAREKVAKLINADSKEIAFMANDTAALNQIYYGVGKMVLNRGDVVVTTKAEHASNLLPLYRLQNDFGIEIKYIELDKQGNVDIEAFKEIMNDKVKFISLAIVTNVLGSMQPIKEIIEIAHSNNALVSLDAAQAIGHRRIDVKELDVDFLAFSSHKMCGPDGVGVLYGKKDLLEEMEPLLLGGGMNARFNSDGSIIYKKAPEKFEAGTPNIEGVIGLGAAVDYLMDIGLDNIHEYEMELRKYFLNKIKEVDTLEIYNEDNESGPITFNVKEVFAQDAAGYLAYHDIAVRSGNHCAKVLHEVIGTDQTIRASLYFYNTYEEVDRFIEVVKNINKESVIDIFF